MIQIVFKETEKKELEKEFAEQFLMDRLQDGIKASVRVV